MTSCPACAALDGHLARCPVEQAGRVQRQIDDASRAHDRRVETLRRQRDGFIRAAREQGVTGPELAARTGLHPSRIGQIAPRGKPG